MPDTLLEILASRLDKRVMVVDKNTRIFAQGAVVEQFYFVKRGRVKLVRDTVDGNPVVQFVALSGDSIAEASLFSDCYHCSAIADIRSELSCFGKAELLALLDREPSLMKQVLTRFARQIRDLRLINELKNIRSARERVLAFVRGQADESGQVVFSLSLKETAYRIGLAHETFYRELSQLEQSGVLQRQAGVIRLL